jgi:elongation factor G
MAFVPVVCGSAFKNKGVQPLLDAVVDYLPSRSTFPPSGPQARRRDAGRASAVGQRAVLGAGVQDHERSVRRHADLRAHLFGQARDCIAGHELGQGQEGKGRPHAADACERARRHPEAFAGDIVALAGLKDTTTGDTLCAINAPIILERMEFPEPVIELSVEPKTKADQEKMGVALNRLAREDPSFRVKTDAESGQTIIKGMGELHLEILVDRMKREFKVEANVGAPQVAYREYLGKPSSIDYTHKKQSGGSGQFARVKVKPTPGERGSGFVFETRSRAVTFPRNISLRSRRASRDVPRHGSLIGFPIIDFEVELYRRRLPRRRLVGPGVRNLRPWLHA